MRVLHPVQDQQQARNLPSPMGIDKFQQPIESGPSRSRLSLEESDHPLVFTPFGAQIQGANVNLGSGDSFCCRLREDLTDPCIRTLGTNPHFEHRFRVTGQGNPNRVEPEDDFLV